MQSGSRKYIVLGLVLLVALGLFWRRSHKPARSAGRTNAKTTTLAAASPVGAKAVTGDDDQTALQDAEDRLAAGFLAVPLSIDKDHAASLNVHLQVRGSCHWGDLDLIGGELAARPGSRLLLTLEPMDASQRGFKPAVRAVTLDELTAGFDHTFAFAQVKASVSLGLFLCSDDGQGERCADKRADDINTAYQQLRQAGMHESSAATPEAYRPPSRIYFFQHVVLDPTQAEVQIGTKMDDEAYARAQKYVAGQTGSERQTKDALARVKELNRKITSIPVQLVHNDLTLVLAGKETSEACQNLAPTSVPTAPRPPAGAQPVERSDGSTGLVLPR